MNIREYEKKYGSVHSAENQEILRRLVDREVYQNISMLVSHFLQNPEALTGSGYDYDEILDLCEIRDYETAAQDEGWKEFENYIDDEFFYFYNEEKEIGSAAETWADLCDDEGIDPVYDPVYEHWVVSDFFRRKLEEKGEVTTSDFFGMEVWGRGCTGQAIMLDGVIAEIAIDMEILTGMRHDWGGVIMEPTISQYTQEELADILRFKKISGIKFNKSDNSFSIKFEDHSILTIQAHAEYTDEYWLNISVSDPHKDWI